jgi:ribosome maturation factor RimP
VIEVKDIIPHSYTLEVSSPGLNRVLKKEKDFLNHLGETVKVKTSQAIDQRKHFQGKLVGCSEGTIIVSTDDQSFLIPLALVMKAHIAYQFPEPQRKKSKATR